MESLQAKILIAGVVRQDPTVLAAHLKTLKWQQLPPHVEVDYLWVDDNADPASTKLLKAYGKTIQPPPRPTEAEYLIGPDTHKWSVETFEHLAKCKQLLLDHALKKRYDYIWLVDSDLLLDPITLKSLFYARRPITSAVFWTQWQSSVEHSLGPNVWTMHPYAFNGLGKKQHEFLADLTDRQFVEVVGGGACILVHTDALKRGLCYHPRLDGLPMDQMWQGEDRSFSIRAERLHTLQFADAWPDIFHAYHPHDRTEEILEEALKVIGAEQQEFANYGDQVNFTLEPLEEPGLQDVVFPIRGRLGGIHCLPELEQALLDTKIGEEAILTLHYPYWFEPVQIPPNPPVEYANKDKTVRLRLLDAKPWSYAPVLHEHAFRGLR